MIEYLVDENLIEFQEPPRMNYGRYLSFKGYNLFGIGQQAIHNAGSSMMRDTPTFKKRVVEFIYQHIDFDTKEFAELIKDGKEEFYEQQKERLNRFEADKYVRFVKKHIRGNSSVLSHLFLLAFSPLSAV